MRLSDLIDTLEAMPADAPVVFDFGTTPTRLRSWRGVYAELTLDSRTNAEPVTAATVLEDARAAIGGIFEGYKGGEYEMDDSTPVWADEWGECSHRMLIGAVLSGGRVVLKTMIRPEEYGW